MKSDCANSRLSWPQLRQAICCLRELLPARRSVSAAVVTAAIGGMPPSASAQTSTRGETYAITRAQGPIVIDGNLNDEGWRDAVRIERWYEINPGDNQSAAEDAAEVRMKRLRFILRSGILNPRDCPNGCDEFAPAVALRGQDLSAC